MKRSFALACFMFMLLFRSSSASAGGPWVDIDTGNHTLYLMQGDKVVQTFEMIAIGKNGVTADKTVSDGKTPLGSYTIRWINDESRFHLFFGLDYPTPKHAVTAFMSDRISAAELEAIYAAHERGEKPSGSTSLGGAIGIHGIGHGDLRIHQNFDWTDGCVALTNEQIDELATKIGLGTTVVVR
jgi:murein L,D-transpeptidase YafK